ncbi:tripartite ATP-independent transporter solute receptor, DctP family [Malonomonas rubra DSM 5091]|uniref:Tripartite ATP-independent transporter solute receptor, DctP family n=1 Tax=Malonomonas rubra DSM 5091 TaxID=1122189 RepID=A0A1M6JZC1_MALRU|nr:DctP family TRAP transporter solute-binding subunit [Malonomonas rubra]SHJ52066.1 tripartite ATP-independent transporter solute receptor, DctP family [Malonomonas rubra DSM 5091]
MKRLLCSLVILLFVASIPTAALAAKVKFGHIAPTFHGMSKGIDAFADYVREKTDGKIDIATFPQGQLGNERSMASQVQSGSLPIAAVTTAVLQNFVPEVAILDMPFLFPNRATAYAVLDDEAVKEKIFSYLPKKGFVGIGWVENEIRDFSNTKRPIRHPEDIKGLKVRVMNSPAYLDTFNQLGASTVGIPFPEVYSALQTGVIDAQENPLMTAVLMKFPEVTKFVTNTQHALTECIIVVNPDFWNRLSPEYQQIFREAAKIATDVNRARNVEIKQSLPKLEISIEEYCKQNNVELINLTDAEREEFRKAMIPVWDKYRGIIGDDIFDFVLAKIEEHKQ